MIIILQDKTTAIRSTNIDSVTIREPGKTSSKFTLRASMIGTEKPITLGTFISKKDAVKELHRFVKAWSNPDSTLYGIPEDSSTPEDFTIADLLVTD